MIGVSPIVISLVVLEKRKGGGDKTSEKSPSTDRAKHGSAWLKSAKITEKA